MKFIDRLKLALSEAFPEEELSISGEGFRIEVEIKKLRKVYEVGSHNAGDAAIRRVLDEIAIMLKRDIFLDTHTNNE